MSLLTAVKRLCLVVAFFCAVYGAGRLYYYITDGFLEENIRSHFVFQKHWDLQELVPIEKAHLDKVLDQDFVYLGKGCQSYVFVSQDGDYVLKFLKYQRFRPQAWIDLFTFWPSVERYQVRKTIEKQEKLEKVFRSWMIAYAHLQSETGVIYVHLNKSQDWDKVITIYDKMGLKHRLDLGQMEFMVQRKAQMLDRSLDELMTREAESEARNLIDHLLAILLSEYSRGFADNDHALMQNTGVLNGLPVHIDVGQFIYNPLVKDSKVYLQEIYDKTFHFHRWLKLHHETLYEHLKSRLVILMGVDYFYMAPYVHKGDVGKIPHQDNFEA